MNLRSIHDSRPGNTTCSATEISHGSTARPAAKTARLVAKPGPPSGGNPVSAEQESRSRSVLKTPSKTFDEFCKLLASRAKRGRRIPRRPEADPTFIEVGTQTAPNHSQLSASVKRSIQRKLPKTPNFCLSFRTVAEFADFQRRADSVPGRGWDFRLFPPSSRNSQIQQNPDDRQLLL